jgi:hypothetical protein
MARKLRTYDPEASMAKWSQAQTRSTHARYLKERGQTIRRLQGEAREAHRRAVDAHKRAHVFLSELRHLRADQVRRRKVVLERMRAKFARELDTARSKVAEVRARIAEWRATFAVRRAEWKDLSELQRLERGGDRAAAERVRAARGTRSLHAVTAERRSESDDEVRSDIEASEPSLLPLWEEVKSTIHGHDKLSRYEEFLHWVHENPDTALHVAETEVHRKLEREIEGWQAAELAAHEARAGSRAAANDGNVEAPEPSSSRRDARGKVLKARPVTEAEVKKAEAKYWSLVEARRRAHKSLGSVETGPRRNESQAEWQARQHRAIDRQEKLEREETAAEARLSELRERFAMQVPAAVESVTEVDVDFPFGVSA